MLSITRMVTFLSSKLEEYKIQKIIKTISNKKGTDGTDKERWRHSRACWLAATASTNDAEASTNWLSRNSLSALLCRCFSCASCNSFFSFFSSSVCDRELPAPGGGYENQNWWASLKLAITKKEENFKTWKDNKKT